MKWQVSILPVAEKLLAAISDTRIRQNISKRIDRLEDDPEKQGKPLSDELAGYRSIRAIGQRYRVIYKVEAERVVVVVVALGIRKEADKKDVNELAKKLVRLGLLDRE
jgi:mRNA interferase RelE/StbE